MRFFPTWLSNLVQAFAPILPAFAPSLPASEPRFERDIFPVIAAHCLKCHGLEALRAGLDLRTVPLMLRGGENGAVLVKGSLDHSRIWKKVSERSMPPKGELPLTEAQVDAFRRWIEAGAPSSDPDDLHGRAGPNPVRADEKTFWSFRALSAPAPSAVQASGRARTPVDAFLLSNLEEKGIGFSADADGATLLRRLHLDLLGLPPPLEQLDALEDGSDEAYERLADRLLASPDFGVRWGRHWLDAGGYVDVYGGDNDAGIVKFADGKWRYRDWVVRSINEDKPYDRFVTEQLAGDELVDWRAAEVLTPEMRDLLTATTFLRCAADDTDENELNTADIRHGVLSRTVETVASNLLALTVNCARCHAHKYDPIPQEDYYRLSALFAPAFNTQSWLQPKQRAIPDVSAAEKAVIEKRNAEIQERIDAIRKDLTELRRPFEERAFEAKLAAIAEADRAGAKAAVRTPAEKRSEAEKALAARFEGALRVTPEEAAAAFGEREKETSESFERRISDLAAGLRGWGTLHAVYDVGPPFPTYVLRRGDHHAPGSEVEPGFLGVLVEQRQGNVIPVSFSKGPPPAGKTSGRRLAFAQWLFDPGSRSSALAARVAVNRAWQRLFGVGLVESSDNFGRGGTPPTHPELLDWLACELRTNGWRLKPLLRLFLTSAAYRQTTTPGQRASQGERVDPENRLLWKMRLRGLESEVVRDAILAASGLLERALGGPPVAIEARPDGSVVVKGEAGAAACRRSLYLFQRRNYHPSFLAVFDQPILSTNCTQRASSAVVLQSLALLNDVFVMEAASRFADRVALAAGPGSAARSNLAFRIALGRPPGREEVEWSARHLDIQEALFREAGSPPEQARLEALRTLCHVLFNTSEFIHAP